MDNLTEFKTFFNTPVWRITSIRGNFVKVCLPFYGNVTIAEHLADIDERKSINNFFISIYRLWES